MKNNSRFLLLEYLYSLGLPFLTQMTICFWDKDFSDNLAQLLLSKPEVTVLHAKGTRVFTKTYPLAEINDTIIDFAIEMKEKMVLSYQDFTYSLKDPYYRKDMRELSFEILLMVPFFPETERITGVALFYFSKKFSLEDESITKISAKGLRKLMESLVQDETEALHQEIVKQTYRELAMPWVLFSDQKVYLSPFMEQALNQETNVISLMQWKELIKANPQLNLVKKTEILNCLVEYYSENNITRIDKPVFAIDYLDRHGLERFTLLFLSYRGWEEKTTLDHFELFNELVPHNKEKPLLYKVNDETIVSLVSGNLDKRFLTKLENRLKDYRFIYMRSGREFPVKLALKPIIDYLMTTNAENFVLSEYLDFRNKQNEHQYLLDAIKDNQFHIKQYPVCNTLNYRKWGTYLIMEVRGVKPTPDFQEFQIKKMMQYLLVNKIEKPIISLDSVLLRKRTIWNQLKKISEIYPDTLTLIVSSTENKRASNSAISDYFHRLRQMGITILVDSTLFSSNLSYQLFPLLEGIAIEDWGLLENDLGKTLISFYLERKKQVIILKSTTNFHHELIYQINKPTS